MICGIADTTMWHRRHRNTHQRAHMHIDAWRCSMGYCMRLQCVRTCLAYVVAQDWASSVGEVGPDHGVGCVARDVGERPDRGQQEA